mmetsp:Transcript_7177/g.12875  ORF Transcript_7177/g.12875 Transcript_7177/m.12875 type:complete len:204 (+) Transcript_7177:881-1492(+)
MGFAVSFDDEELNSFLTPSTDHAVVKRVKKNPPTTTAATLATSAEDPKDGARGSVTRLGTKNTGNHLANTADPGASLEYKVSPPGRIKSPTSKAPQAASDDGNVICNRLHRALAKTSNNTSDTVENTAFIILLLFVLSVSAADDIFSALLLLDTLGLHVYRLGCCDDEDMYIMLVLAEGDAAEKITRLVNRMELLLALVRQEL